MEVLCRIFPERKYCAEAVEYEIPTFIWGSTLEREGSGRFSENEPAEYSYDYESLAESIRDNLGDKKWAELVEQKAAKKATKKKAIRRR